MAESASAYAPPLLELGPAASSRRDWLRSLWEHRGIIWVLARKDFQVRYKRATLGVLWAVAVPALQAAVLAFVFSHFVRTGKGIPYGAFVLSGVLAWSYFAGALPIGVTSIVDGSGLTDKVWFPRAILPLVPCLSGLVGLGISMVLLLIAAPLLGAPVHLALLLLLPACVLLLAFTVALTMVLSALQVYYRDIRFMVTAALAVWIYATPIMYPKSLVGSLGPWLDLNPMTGIVSLFHIAVVGSHESWVRAVTTSVVVTVLLTVAGLEAQRRHDRVFVDQL